jgi:sec-independent protein translocase protein TatB
MELFGVGLPELFFIVLIALIVLGPRDMVKAGRTIGVWLRKLVTSEGWQVMKKTTRELQTLPNKLMREAGMDEIQKDVSGLAGGNNRYENGSPATPPAVPPQSENKIIAPPPAEETDPIDPQA